MPKSVGSPSGKVMAGLPVAKLLGLGLKQVSKPLASQLKRWCTSNDTAMAGTLWVGQHLHLFGVRVSRAHAGFGTIGREVTPLKDAKALERGADFIGEAFVFSIAAGVTVNEYARSRAKEAKVREEKEERKRLKHEKMVEDAAARDTKIQRLEEAIQELQGMQTAIAALQGSIMGGLLDPGQTK